MRYVWDILKNEPNFASFWTKLRQKEEKLFVFWLRKVP